MYKSFNVKKSLKYDTKSYKDCWGNLRSRSNRSSTIWHYFIRILVAFWELKTHRYFYLMLFACCLEKLLWLFASTFCILKINGKSFCYTQGRLLDWPWIRFAWNFCVFLFWNLCWWNSCRIIILMFGIWKLKSHVMKLYSLKI